MITANIIKYTLSKRHWKDFFATEVKCGPTWGFGSLQIIDAVGIKKSWARPCVTFYEVKCSHSDFVQDSKWPSYLEHCNRFYFACPSRIIQRNEIDPKVGLIWINEDKGHRVVKAAPMMANELSYGLLYYIIMNQIESDRHPFFSTARKMLEAWIKDKELKRQLAWDVKSKLITEWDNARTESTRLTSENAQLKSTIEEYEKGLKEVGINSRSWGWENILKNKINGTAHTRILKDLKQALDTANKEINRLLVMSRPVNQEKDIDQ